MTITNKTRKPLSVPLPGGRKLHLGPGKSGQISAKAADHPPLKALLDAGEIEITEGGRSSTGGSGGGRKGRTADPGHTGTGGIRHTGDR